ncbi:hypothetical protein BD410DRAFT_581837 [Rickenella mellea]|uniref:Uncharacterized protein n=1 Tax=Rickenella mellea TaxID=50990 RepID=A0A4Y7PQ86_9AGAM|nr:hypothetical protein BD410DRAFT_581837 [Rickenella mellea]
MYRVDKLNPPIHLNALISALNTAFSAQRSHPQSRKRLRIGYLNYPSSGDYGDLQGEPLRAHAFLGTGHHEDVFEAAINTLDECDNVLIAELDSQRCEGVWVVPEEVDEISGRSLRIRFEIIAITDDSNVASDYMFSQHLTRFEQKFRQSL